MKALIAGALVAMACAQGPRRGPEADEWTRAAIRSAPPDPDLPPGLHRYSDIRDRLPRRRCVEWVSYLPGQELPAQREPGRGAAP